jgi:hypothetical protein
LDLAPALPEKTSIGLSPGEDLLRFAKIVFWSAAIGGLLLLTPLYFLFDSIGRNNPPPITHADFFYGFVGVALAWQLAFIVIARDPARFRPLMIPSIFEKLNYAIAVSALVSQGRVHKPALVFGGVDPLLGILFAISYFKAKAPALGSTDR